MKKNEECIVAIQFVKHRARWSKTCVLALSPTEYQTQECKGVPGDTRSISVNQRGTIADQCFTGEWGPEPQQETLLLRGDFFC